MYCVKYKYYFIITICPPLLYIPPLPEQLRLYNLNAYVIKCDQHTYTSALCWINYFECWEFKRKQKHPPLDPLEDVGWLRMEQKAIIIIAYRKGSWSRQAEHQSCVWTPHSPPPNPVRGFQCLSQALLSTKIHSFHWSEADYWLL